LKQAQERLNENDDLEGAVSIYREALNQPGNHPSRGTSIRKALKEFSDRLSAQSQWDTAEKALFEALDDLRLAKEGEEYNVQVLKWRQEFVLAGVAMILNEKDEVQDAIDKLKAVPFPLPLDRLPQIFWQYSKTRVESNTEETLEKSVEALEKLAIYLADKGDSMSVRKSLADLAQELGRILREKDKVRADRVFELALVLSH
jgi:hypothetical protein